MSAYFRVVRTMPCWVFLSKAGIDVLAGAGGLVCRRGFARAHLLTSFLPNIESVGVGVSTICVAVCRMVVGASSCGSLMCFELRSGDRCGRDVAFP